MERCKTCAYWKLSADPEKGRTCKSPKVLRGYTYDQSDVPDGLLVENDEGWGCITGPDFGCIHHSPAQTNE